MVLKPLVDLLSATLLNILSWPPIALICPLYASFRAMESDSLSKYQQCLTFWVLFALLAILEEAIGDLLMWLRFWPYAKGTLTVLLVVPYFSGASYVYKKLVRMCPIENYQLSFLIWNILFSPMKECFSLLRDCFSISGTDENITLDGEEVLENPIIYQEKSKPNNENVEKDHKPSSIPKSAQKEWSCALCLISTSSEKCLKEHLKGKMHKAKKEELRAKESALKLASNSSHMVNRNNGIFVFGNLVNLENWNGIISPVARSMKWCRWKRPDVGWIKLNTDGSIDRENAGFGGLLRDYKGDAICAFVSKAPLDDIFLVELWAIWRGLVLALGLGIKALWVESDSMSAVKTINKEQSHSGKADECLKQIWTLLKQFEKYRISHAWRETNKAADFLSRMVLDRNDVVLWPVHFPDTLQNIIKDDAYGRVYFRR